MMTYWSVKFCGLFCLSNLKTSTNNNKPSNKLKFQCKVYHRCYNQFFFCILIKTTTSAQFSACALFAPLIAQNCCRMDIAPISSYWLFRGDSAGWWERRLQDKVGRVTGRLFCWSSRHESALPMVRTLRNVSRGPRPIIKSTYISINIAPLQNGVNWTLFMSISVIRSRKPVLPLIRILIER